MKRRSVGFIETTIISRDYWVPLERCSPKLMFDVKDTIQHFREDLLEMDEIQYNLTGIISNYIDYRDDPSAPRDYVIRECSELSDQDAMLLHLAIVGLYKTFDRMVNDSRLHPVRVMLSKDESTLLITGSIHESSPPRVGDA